MLRKRGEGRWILIESTCLCTCRCLFLCLLTGCLYVCLHAYLSVSVCLQAVCVRVCLSVCVCLQDCTAKLSVSVCLQSVCLCACLSVSVCLSARLHNKIATVANRQDHRDSPQQQHNARRIFSVITLSLIPAPYAAQWVAGNPTRPLLFTHCDPIHAPYFSE